MLSIVVWGVIAFAGYLGAILLFQAIWGPDGGGRSELLRVLSATGIAGLLTIAQFSLLLKWKLKCQAISVLVVAVLLGGYFLLLIAAFGGFD